MHRHALFDPRWSIAANLIISIPPNSRGVRLCILVSSDGRNNVSGMPSGQNWEELAFFYPTHPTYSQCRNTSPPVS